MTKEDEREFARYLENIPPLGSVVIDDVQVKYQVWATIEAVLETDKGDKRIPRLVGPVKLAVEDGLFQAMMVLSIAGSIPEYMASVDELIEMAEVIGNKIENKEYKWE